MLEWTQDRDADGVLCLGVPGVGKSFLTKCLGATFGVPVVNFNLGAMQGGIIGSSGQNLRAAQATIDAISGGRVLWVATCNSVEALPAELRARFKTAQFFFDVPTATERASIWTLYRSKYGIPATDAAPDDNGWTGREIRECTAKAYRMRMSLQDAARYVVPVTRSASERIAALRAASSGKYLSASNPGIYTAITGTIQPATVAPVTGRVVRFDS
jgi:AAA+ superfamily predicted ATPase